jgi:threonine dehydratase
VGTHPGASSRTAPASDDYSDAAFHARLIDARERVSAVAHHTPVLTCCTLDERFDTEVFFKCENLQRVGAFKYRGAYNMISRIPDDVRRKGVVAFSSGNHGQAVALVSRQLEIPATIVMTSKSPKVKLDAVRGYGADIEYWDLAGEDREDMARRLAREMGRLVVPSFDHPDIMAGQGTVALELCEEVGPLDVLITPVGGGGLLSGSALAMNLMCPGVSVVGVEPDAGNDGCESFRTGTLVRRTCGETIADGAKPPSLGHITFAVIQRHVSDMVSVPDAALIEAMRFVWERMKLVVEPTAVLGLAALMTGRVNVEGKRVGVILSGGNVDLGKAAGWMKQ